MGVLDQSFRIPKPTITEENCPDQTGKVHIVTGGYGGCGLELCDILYQYNATLYIAGRTQSKADEAIARLRKEHPTSKGSASFLLLDLADLTTIKSAVTKFSSLEKQLHVLTLNAGVMMTPNGSKTTQGYDLQVGTNCLGSYLLYKLLRPTLLETAKTAEPATVRVTWASSLAADLMSPKPGGVKFSNGITGAPHEDLGTKAMYGQSKAGNRFLAAASSRADAEHNILHVAWNPGNVATDLTRHLSKMEALFTSLLQFPARFGGYTELFSAIGPIDMSSSGCYVAPWGRIDKNRDDIEEACEKGKGADKFVGWCDSVTARYA